MGEEQEGWYSRWESSVKTGWRAVPQLPRCKLPSFSSSYPASLPGFCRCCILKIKRECMAVNLLPKVLLLCRPRPLYCPYQSNLTEQHHYTGAEMMMMIGEGVWSAFHQIHLGWLPLWVLRHSFIDFYGLPICHQPDDFHTGGGGPSLLYDEVRQALFLVSLNYFSGLQQKQQNYHLC